MMTLRKLLGDRYEADGMERLNAAFASLFAGNGTVDDAELVLDDLLQYSGYYDTTLPMDENGRPVPPEVLWHIEGMRALMARILFMTDLPISELRKHAAQRGQAQD